MKEKKEVPNPELERLKFEVGQEMGIINKNSSKSKEKY